jgi:hexosaminidase
MKKTIVLLLLGLSAMAQNEVSIIPLPKSITVGLGKFYISENTKIVVDANDAQDVAEQLALKLRTLKGKLPDLITTPLANSITFKKNISVPREGYELKVKPTGVTIEAAGPIGYFYGMQSLLQLLPPEAFGASLLPNTTLSLTECHIKDQPRFEYRGIMLDVARYFYPIEFIKKLVDVLAIHKFNSLHLHLTDDQGWRMEIKKYPKLTELGSTRKESMLGHYRDQKFDGTPHGGFYTQAQMKELVAYAQRKFITIVPEIEMPGHALAALAAYPELGCTNGPYEVGTKWGVEERVFCPSEKTFTFIEDVLGEVMEIFPSPYIHVGGDECPKTTWKASTFCQDLIKKEGLKDEHGLQSYFMKRVDKIISSKGRKMLGWDEILEGGLSPNATVMSWRGIEGGIEAAKQSHDVVMSPNSHVYLDYYQADPAFEPLAIGGFLPLEKTYSYEPIPAELSSEQAKHIKGIQANLWTEYVPTPEHAEYMLFPRALAVAEIGWSDKTKSYTDFVKRLSFHFQRLDYLAVNYSKAAFNVKFSLEKDPKGLTAISLSTLHPQNSIRYTLDGSLPNAQSLLYDPTRKLTMESDKSVAAAVFSKFGEMRSAITSKTFVISKTTGRPYKLAHAPKKYFGGDEMALTNGERGDVKSKEGWVGFEGTNLDVVLDLNKPTSFSNLSVGFLSDPTSWVMLPPVIEIAISSDNLSFKSIKKLDLGKSTKPEVFVQQLNIALEPSTARYIRVQAENYGLLPVGHTGAGKPAWLFIDEIGVK